MIVYYHPSGELWNAVLDRDGIVTVPDVNAQEYAIDEIDANKDLLIALSQQATQRDSNGLGRWYVENNNLFERPGWVAKVYP